MTTFLSSRLSPRLDCRFAAGLLLCAALALPVLSQEAPPQKAGEPASGAGNFTFRQNVSRVLLDVMVTDNEGRPIHGLTQSDFKVEEDGAPQAIASFDVHSFDGPMDYDPPHFPAQPLHSYVNLPLTPERGPLYVLFYDLVNISMDEQMFARKRLVKFIQEKPAGARFAIFVNSDGVHLVQGFTSDEKTLLAAVDPRHPRPHMPALFQMGVNNGQGDKLAAAARLNSIARYLSGLPGRKNLFWISSQFPLALFPSREDSGVYQREVRSTMYLLAHDRIAVYPIDTSGVIVDEEHAPPGAVNGDGAGLGTDAREEGIKPIGQPASDAAAINKTAVTHAAQSAGGLGYSLQNSSYMSQDEIAKMTGGHAFHGLNSIEIALDRATADGGTYYSLTYAPPNREKNGEMRRIRVTSKKGYQLSYRQAYYADERSRPSSDAQLERDAAGGLPASAGRSLGDLLSASMVHGMPVTHDLIFGAHVEPAAEGDVAVEPGAGGGLNGGAPVAQFVAKKKGGHHVATQLYTIRYTVMAHQLRLPPATPPALEMATAAYDVDGEMLSSAVNETSKEADPSGAPRTAFQLEQQIEVPASARYMRMAIRDARTDRVGAMEITLPLEKDR